MAKRVALALGSGGARGYAHIGVIDELISRGYEVVGVAGSSMGAMVGGLFAAGSLGEFTQWASTLTGPAVLRLLDPSISAAGVLRAGKILDAVRDLLGVATEIVGVVADRAPAHALSFAAGRPISTPDADTFVDGVATRTPVPEAVAAMVAGAARFVRVGEDDAEAAMRTLWQTTHQMPEPAGAISLAGLLGDTGRPPGATAAVIMSGGNCDTDLVLKVLAG